jgi:hypothetical protein
MNRTRILPIVKVCARATVFLSVGFVILSAGKARAQLEPLVLYDDFSAPTISASKWFGGEGFDFLGLEAKRGVSNGQLELATRSVGFTASDSGVGTNSVFLAHPAPEEVTDMRVKITASRVRARGCATNSNDVTETFAVLSGAFFNTAAPQPVSASSQVSNNDRTNDVVAAIGLYSNSTFPAGAAGVLFYVIECTNNDCSTFDIIDADLLADVPVGTEVNVRMQWDQTNHQFTFGQSANDTVSVPYAVSDSSSPGMPFKRLEVSNSVANCTTEPRPIAEIAALFDDVSVNQSAVP